MNLHYFGFILLPLVIATSILCYFRAIKPYGKQKRCTQKTKGTVIGLSHLSYDSVRIPLIEYVVDGQSFKIAGPRFRSYVSKSSHSTSHDVVTQFGTNLTNKEQLPDKLIIYSNENSLIRISSSPLLELFPIGSVVDVYYNPRHPKDAYVIRDCPPPNGIRYALFGVTGSLILLMLYFFLH